MGKLPKSLHKKKKKIAMGLGICDFEMQEKIKEYLKNFPHESKFCFP